MVGGSKWASLGLAGALGCATGGENDVDLPLPSSLGDGTDSTSSDTTGDETAGSSGGASGSGEEEGSTEAPPTSTAVPDSTGSSSGGGCTTNAECPSGLCAFEACQSVESCADLLAKDPVAVSGEYEITPVGVTEPYPVYCDMVTDGGGWTLVMKLTSGSNTFAYGASSWTTTDVVNPDDTMPNAAAVGTNAKLASFNDVPGATLRLEWVESQLSGHAFVFDALAGRTALELFSGRELMLGGDEGGGCNPDALADAPGYLSQAMRHGQGRQFYGINGGDDGDGPIRFGFGSNDEDGNTWGAKQGIGTDDESVRWSSHDDCNNCGCYGNEYNSDQVSANLWVR